MELPYARKIKMRLFWQYFIPVLCLVAGYFFGKKKSGRAITGSSCSSTSTERSDSGPSASDGTGEETSNIVKGQLQCWLRWFFSSCSHNSTPRKADDLSASSSSATSMESNNYQVFLSFRGQDIRRQFADHLYYGLVDAGIRTFRDDNELPSGERVGPNLFHAIKNNKISIPVLSQHYASSKWCLQELAQMVECMKSSKHVILPIFYHVEPADVKYQTGIFGETFSHLRGKHEKKNVDKWTQALEEVASLKGWVSTTTADGREGELVRQVVARVWSELKKGFQLNVTDQLVGIDKALEDVLRLLNKNPGATRIVSIHGMGGIGKTTLAKVVYNKLSDQFQHRSFIADIRESSQRNGISSLQNQLIFDILKTKDQVSNTDAGINIMKSQCIGKKVLILLDDVDHADKLNPLIGRGGWFEKGSRIIITTRTKDVLNDDDVNCKYELKEIDPYQSLILFSRHAFLENSPPSRFADLSNKIISTTGGLPLALKVIGSFLHRKDEKFWQGALKKLEKVPHNDVQEKLRISYDVLKIEEQQIFLDIACFFSGTDVRVPTYMWNEHNFYPEMGIDELCCRSLVKIGDNHELIMQDQLRGLGKRIASEESPLKRSRLWAYKGYEEGLKKLQEDKKVNKNIEALLLDKDCSSQFKNPKNFKRMPYLKFLHLSAVEFVGDFENSLSELRWLKWEMCPDSPEVPKIHLKNLLILDLSCGYISENWGGWSSIEMERLKVLNLSGCSQLKSTPNLSAFANLEMLILENCENLETIDSSIGDLKYLVSLNLRYCGSLKGLPAELGELKKLEELVVDETDIQKIPECIGSLVKLETLSALGCRLLTEVPRSISHLVNLSTLNLNACKKLRGLPDSFQALGNLQRLRLERCYMLRELPCSIGELGELVELDLSFTGIKELPESINKLNKLEILRIPHSKIEKLPKAIGKLQSLQELDASGCQKLEEIVLVDIGGLSSLRTLRLGRAKISHLPDICELSTLEHLDLLYCSKLQSLPVPPSGLSSLQLTCLSDTLPSLSHLSNLKKLTLRSSMNLQSISDLPSCIRKLWVWKCPKLQRLSNLPYLKSLLELELLQCYGLYELDGLEALESLRKLDISLSTDLSNLNDFEDLESLRDSEMQFHDVEAGNFRQIPGLGKLKSLEVLNISGRKHIEVLDLSKAEHLQQLIVNNCQGLDKIHLHDMIDTPEHFDRVGCQAQITRLPRTQQVN